MMKCYWIDTDIFYNEKQYSFWRDQMSENRKSKIDFFRFRKDQNLSLGAGVLMDHALKEWNLREHEMVYGEMLNHKPVFLNAPEIHFNLSHSGTKVLAAFSDKEIGCDIEKIEPIDLEIAEKYFHRSEYKSIQTRQTVSEKQELFFRYWTLKESFMKITGLGFGLDLSDFEILIKETGISVIQTADRRDYYFREFHEIPGYKAAICYLNKNETIDLREITV